MPGVKMYSCFKVASLYDALSNNMRHRRCMSRTESTSSDSGSSTTSCFVCCNQHNCQCCIGRKLARDHVIVCFSDEAETSTGTELFLSICRLWSCERPSQPLGGHQAAKGRLKLPVLTGEHCLPKPQIYFHHLWSNVSCLNNFVSKFKIKIIEENAASIAFTDMEEPHCLPLIVISVSLNCL